MVAASRRVVNRVLGPKRRFGPELARETLHWQFTERDRERVSALLEKHSANEATRAEQSELFTLVALGDFLDVLHARAKLTLQKRTIRVS